MVTGPDPAVPSGIIAKAASAIHDLPFVVELRRTEPDACRKIATAALEAAAPHLEAAARERCAQLAEQVKAQYPEPHPVIYGGDPLTYHPFADLLRQGGEGGGA